VADLKESAAWLRWKGVPTLVRWLQQQKLEMGRVEAPGRQLHSALGRAGAFGFNGAQGKRLWSVEFQSHPSAQVIQPFREGEAV